MGRNISAANASTSALRSPLHGGVGRNPFSACHFHASPSSPLHGGVGRNTVTGNTLADRRGRPFTGAWVETSRTGHVRSRSEVAPSRGRGSKLERNIEAVIMAVSPLHGGVGRNLSDFNGRQFCRVAPSRGRGSKPGWTDGTPRRSEVAPSRGRGSKHLPENKPAVADGRPFTGAWVET